MRLLDKMFPPTEKELARRESLIDLLAEYTEDMSKAKTVDEFVFSYSGLTNILYKLIYLVDKRQAHLARLEEHPRDILNKINNNMPSTIKAFIVRAEEFLTYQGEHKAWQMQQLADQIEHDETLNRLMSAENIEQISSLRRRASFIIDEIRRKELEKVAEERRMKEKAEAELRARKEAEVRKRRQLADLDQAGLQIVDCSDLPAIIIIPKIEERLENAYLHYVSYGHSPAVGRDIFNRFRSVCTASKFPLAVDIRLEQLYQEYEPKFSKETDMFMVDQMDGSQFEIWCASLLRRNGFSNVEIVAKSGDQGVDIIAEKDEIKYAIQCKCYSSDLGNSPVQQINTGKMIYHCHVGAVMTNRHFTKGALAAAEATGTLLWDRDKLRSMIQCGNSGVKNFNNASDL